MKTEHIKIKPSDERTGFLLVEAIIDGFHVRVNRGRDEILTEHTEEDEEYISFLLGGTTPSPVRHLDAWAKNLVERIESLPNSHVIQCNSFEYVDGAYPDQH